MFISMVFNFKKVHQMEIACVHRNCAVPWSYIIHQMAQFATETVLTRINVTQNNPAVLYEAFYLQISEFSNEFLLACYSTLNVFYIP